MRTIKFYGSSDDLIELVDPKGNDEFGEYSSTLKKPFEIKAADGELKIYPVYDGCWMFAVGQTDEDKPLPMHWNPTIGQEHEYSTFLELTIPDGAVITWLDDEDE